MRPTSRSWWTWRSLCHDICSWVAKLFSKEEAGGVTTVVLCNIRADGGGGSCVPGHPKASDIIMHGNDILPNDP